MTFVVLLKGGRAYAVYEADLLLDSAMIGTGKIFYMIVPTCIYERFMGEKIWIINYK